MKSSRALVGGSFDPVTVGHMDIIMRASRIFTQVLVVVFINAEKEYLFTLDERKKLLEAACSDLPNIKVHSSEGLLAEYAASHSIDAVVKGVRNAADAEYEIMMAHVNNEIVPGTETLLLPSKANLSNVSSTLVRKCIEEGRDMSEYIPANVHSLLVDMLRRRT